MEISVSLNQSSNLLDEEMTFLKQLSISLVDTSVTPLSQGIPASGFSQEGENPIRALDASLKRT